MGDRTGIEWTDATWNPATGCTKVSQGCKHCYAERVFPRVYGGQSVLDTTSPAYLGRGAGPRRGPARPPAAGHARGEWGVPVMLDKGAIFSPCRTYRYSLWRRWHPGLMTTGHYALFIGLNPSTADETQDDPTIRRCIGFSKLWGYGGLVMANLFAFRATDPRQMKRAAAPVGPENDEHLQALADDVGLVICAWGVHGQYLRRDAIVRQFLPRAHHLGLTRDGCPRHPLYLPKTTRPQPWPAPAADA